MTVEYKKWFLDVDNTLQLRLHPCSKMLYTVDRNRGPIAYAAAGEQR